MKTKRSFYEMLQLVSCEKKNCKHWVSVGDIYDLEQMDANDGICDAGSIIIKDKRCTTFKYRDKHMLSKGQKVLI